MRESGYPKSHRERFGLPSTFCRAPAIPIGHEEGYAVHAPTPTALSVASDISENLSCKIVVLELLRTLSRYKIVCDNKSRYQRSITRNSTLVCCISAKTAVRIETLPFRAASIASDMPCPSCMASWLCILPSLLVWGQSSASSTAEQVGCSCSRDAGTNGKLWLLRELSSFRCSTHAKAKHGVKADLDSKILWRNTSIGWRHKHLWDDSSIFSENLATLFRGDPKSRTRRYLFAAQGPMYSLPKNQAR